MICGKINLWYKLFVKKNLSNDQFVVLMICQSICRSNGWSNNKFVMKMFFEQYIFVQMIFEPLICRKYDCQNRKCRNFLKPSSVKTNALCPACMHGLLVQIKFSFLSTYIKKII